MQYRLRTLLIVLAVLPPAIAWGYWNAERYHRRQGIKRLVLEMDDYSGSRLLRLPKSAMDYDQVKWQPAGGGPCQVSEPALRNRST